jgi:tRNA (adenine22-N1)-methyltransferase
MTRLSPRLEKALEYTKGFSLLADIGTDHALLPIKAVSFGYVPRAIAIDNKQKPLDNAKKNIVKAKLDQAITAVLSDGLSNVQEPCDVVAILGMGGIAIAEILGKANLQS